MVVHTRKAFDMDFVGDFSCLGYFTNFLWCMANDAGRDRLYARSDPTVAAAKAFQALSADMP